MFRNVIVETPMTTRFAEEFFKNKIRGDDVNGDRTFVSTLRALVAPRMSENDRIYFGFANISVPSRIMREEDPDIAAKILYGIGDASNALVLRNFSGQQECTDKILNSIEHNIENMLPGWHRIMKVTDFYRKVFRVLCYINTEKRGVMIFADNMDTRKMHYLQCGIFAFFPWYFDPSKGIDEDGMELINSLREKTSEKYEACIEKIAEKYDFRTAAIKGMLTGFELKYERLRLDSAKRDAENIMDSINSYNQEIANLLRKKRDIDVVLAGLSAKIESGESENEIMDYFISNKKLTLRNVEDTTVEFVVKDYLEYFDSDEAFDAIKNSRSFVYSYCNDNMPKQYVKMLMQAIFVDQTLRMKFCAAYQFRIDGNIRGQRHYSYGTDCREYMPNTHIDSYACLGNYEREINMLLAEHNYIGAIDQCIASCKSLNFADYTVMSKFMEYICGRDCGVNTRCIELPDGSVVTPKAAIEYLRRQNGEEI